MTVSVETLEAACARIAKLEGLLRECQRELEPYVEYIEGKPNSEMVVFESITKELS